MNTEISEKLKKNEIKVSESTDEKICEEENKELDQKDELNFEEKTSAETPQNKILGNKRILRASLVCHFFPCMKEFRSRENLDLHIMNIHLKIKPFTCDFCEKKFSHRNGKNYHERTRHLNTLPFECSYEGCFKKYASKSALSFHQQSKHVN